MYVSGFSRKPKPSVQLPTYRSAHHSYAGLTGRSGLVHVIVAEQKLEEFGRGRQLVLLSLAVVCLRLRAAVLFEPVQLGIVADVGRARQTVIG